MAARCVASGAPDSHDNGGEWLAEGSPKCQVPPVFHLGGGWTSAYPGANIGDAVGDCRFRPGECYR